MAKKPKPIVRYRSADDGQFVKKTDADKKPKEHIKDVMPRKPKPKGR